MEILVVFHICSAGNETVKMALVSALHGRVPMQTQASEQQEGAEIEMRILLAPLLKLEFSIQHSDRPAPIGEEIADHWG